MGEVFHGRPGGIPSRARLASVPTLTTSTTMATCSSSARPRLNSTSGKTASTPYRQASATALPVVLLAALLLQKNESDIPSLLYTSRQVTLPLTTVDELHQGRAVQRLDVWRDG
jgi:hypothetical protein